MVAAPSLRYWRGAVMITLALYAVVAVRIAEVVPGAAALKPALTLGFLGSILLWSYTSKRVSKDALHDRGMQAAIAYLCIAVLSTPFAYWQLRSFYTVQGLVFALLTMFAYLTVSPNPRDYDRVRRGMFVIAAIFGVLVARQGHVVEGTRLSTTGTLDANDLAANTALMVPLAFASVVRGRGLERVLGLVGGAVLLYVIAQTGSRGGFVALVIGVLVFVMALDARRTMLGVAAVVLGAVAMWRLGPQTFRDRMATLTSVESDYNTTTEGGRLAIWGRALGYVADRPILGVGPNNMQEAEGRRLRRLGITGHWWPAHNAYIQAFVEVGIVGGVVFLWMIGIAVRRAVPLWRGGGRANRRPEVLASLLAYCGAIVFLSHAFSYMLFAVFGFTALAWRTFGRQSSAGAPAIPAPAVPGQEAVIIGVR
jgi:O-antigen ligase